MTNLISEQCEACRPDSTPVSPGDQEELATQIPEWTQIDVKGEHRLRRIYSLPDYQHSLALTQRIGEIAIAEDHHPSILVTWGKVTVTWWTHAIHGLHRNDYIMAAKSDAAYAQIVAG